MLFTATQSLYKVSLAFLFLFLPIFPLERILRNPLVSSWRAPAIFPSLGICIAAEFLTPGFLSAMWLYQVTIPLTSLNASSVGRIWTAGEGRNLGCRRNEFSLTQSGEGKTVEQLPLGRWVSPQGVGFVHNEVELFLNTDAPLLLLKENKENFLSSLN